MSRKTLRLQNYQDILESRIDSALQLAKTSKQEIVLSHSLKIDAIDLVPNPSYPSLNLSDIKEIEIPIPSLDAQLNLINDNFHSRGFQHRMRRGDFFKYAPRRPEVPSPK